MLAEDGTTERLAGAERACEIVRETWRAFEEFNLSPPLALEALFIRLRRELGGPVPPVEEVEDDGASATERRAELEDALSCLSPEERVAVELYIVEEMPAEAVAKVVGWQNAKAVYNHVYRALAAMRARLSTLDGPGRYMSGKI